MSTMNKIQTPKTYSMKKKKKSNKQFDSHD